MKTILFTKHLQKQSVSQLISLGHEWGLDGFDLCVRPDYTINPDNMSADLPSAARLMRQEGLDIPMVTANFDVLAPEHPTAIPLLKAMDAADIRYLKLGYFMFKPKTMNYQVEIAKVRATLKSWIPYARQYNVKVCYHTHSGYHMGINGAALAHILEDIDPQFIGAYLDPAHQRINGEPFDYTLNMVKPWLSLVALKDAKINFADADGHGKGVTEWTAAGKGMVDWTYVFNCLREIGYDNPVSIHAEYMNPNDPDILAKIKDEVTFFTKFTR